ncbi:hypothetical protein FCV25MIE_30731 [Fagus crenata]
MVDDSNTRDDRLMAMLAALVDGQNQLRGELQGLTQVLRGHEDHHRGENDREVYGGERNNHNDGSHNKIPPLDD